MITENTRVRSTRTLPPKKFVVNGSTIGCDTVFELKPKNISKTGLLLTWKATPPAPFRKLTILDITIDPRGDVLERPIPCLGQIARIINLNEEKYYGIQIIQIEPKYQEIWESMVSGLEKDVID